MDNTAKTKRFFIPALPANLNQYIGRTNIWNYHADRKKYTALASKYVKPLYLKQAKITLVYHFPDKRKRDPNNLDKCLLDALVECGVIEDDNYMCITELTESGVYDKDNPGVEIIIEDVDRTE